MLAGIKRDLIGFTLNGTHVRQPMLMLVCIVIYCHPFIQPCLCSQWLCAAIDNWPKLLSMWLRICKIFMQKKSKQNRYLQMECRVDSIILICSSNNNMESAIYLIANCNANIQMDSFAVTVFGFVESSRQWVWWSFPSYCFGWRQTQTVREVASRGAMPKSRTLYNHLFKCLKLQFCHWPFDKGRLICVNVQ